MIKEEISNQLKTIERKMDDIKDLAKERDRYFNDLYVDKKFDNFLQENNFYQNKIEQRFNETYEEFNYYFNKTDEIDTKIGNVLEDNLINISKNIDNMYLESITLNQYLNQVSGRILDGETVSRAEFQSKAEDYFDITNSLNNRNNNILEECNHDIKKYIKENSITSENEIESDFSAFR